MTEESARMIRHCEAIIAKHEKFNGYDAGTQALVYWRASMTLRKGFGQKDDEWIEQNGLTDFVKWYHETLKEREWNPGKAKANW